MGCRSVILARVTADSDPETSIEIPEGMESLIVVNPLQVPIHVRFGPEAVDLTVRGGWDVAAPGQGLYAIPLPEHAALLSVARADYDMVDPSADALERALIMVSPCPGRVSVGPLA